MKARRLHPWPDGTPRAARPLCAADVALTGQWQEDCRTHWHAKGAARYRRLERPAQCTFPAVVELDGVPYCRRHAGQIVLDALLRERGE